MPPQHQGSDGALPVVVNTAILVNRRLCRRTRYGFEPFLMPRLRLCRMSLTRCKRCCIISLVFAATYWATAQPGPFITLRNSNIVFNASTLLTNGLPGLIGPAANLMVVNVQTNSVQSGQARLSPTTLWRQRYIGPGNYYDQPADLVLDSSANVIVTGSSYGSGTSDDYATIKYSPTGTALGTNRFNGAANASDGASLVAVDGGDNIYVTGKSDNSSVIV